MSSEIDICNLALANIGDEAQVSAINPPDGSVQAAHCARFYPICRDALLEMHTWRFAVFREDLALLAVTPPYGWAYAYGLPNDCLVPMAVLAPGDESNSSLDWLIGQDTAQLTLLKGHPDNNQQRFVVESQSDGSLVLYTNIENAILVFIKRVTDTSKYGPLFVLALARLLSSKLAGPIIKGDEGTRIADEQMKLFLKSEYPAAVGRNKTGSEQNVYADAVPDSVAARQ